jgi:hypothetical protein
MAGARLPGYARDLASHRLERDLRVAGFSFHCPTKATHPPRMRAREASGGCLKLENSWRGALLLQRFASD